MTGTPALSVGWQSAAAYYGCAPLVLYAGSKQTLEVSRGSMTVLFPVFGTVTVAKDAGNVTTARRGEPVILRHGRYTIAAKSRVLLLKGERCLTLKSQ